MYNKTLKELLQIANTMDVNSDDNQYLCTLVYPFVIPVGNADEIRNLDACYITIDDDEVIHTLYIHDEFLGYRKNYVKKLPVTKQPETYQSHHLFTTDIDDEDALFMKSTVQDVGDITFEDIKNARELYKKLTKEQISVS